MSYSYKPKPVPCTASNNGKHKWTFVKNFTQKSFSVTPNGTTGRFTTKGWYRCACGMTKAGAYNVNAPGMDLRDATMSLEPDLAKAKAGAPGRTEA